MRSAILHLNTSSVGGGVVGDGDGDGEGEGLGDGEGLGEGVGVGAAQAAKRSETTKTNETKAINIFVFNSTTSILRFCSVECLI